MSDAERIRVVFDQAADLTADARAAFLDRACQGEPDLRAVVEELLAQDSRFEGRDDPAFLKSPLVLAQRPTLPSAPAHDPVLPRAIGKYRILGRLGEGGMGTVYEAEQDEPRRTVALKVMRRGSDSPDLRKRFAREANILGRLSHAGIAHVYDAGAAEDGQLYFAMEFIRGLPLDEHVRRHAPDARARLELAARVCDAVQHAHEQGVVHRDLKPSNVLVDGTGRPKVLDFGVAHATGAGHLDSTAHTRTGQLVGTLGYMSPEQVAADPRAIDARSDVYALGVILFELLAGRLPYQIDDLPIPEVVRVIREVEPSRLGSVDREFRGAIETIVSKALEKDKARRYQSAGELADDLRRYLADRAIRARPASALYKARRFVSRNKGLVAGTAVVFAALLAATVLSLLSAREARESARIADENAREARENADLARAQTARTRSAAYHSRLAGAVGALSGHDVTDAARHLEHAPEELRGWEWRHLHSRLDDRSGKIAAEPGASLFLLHRVDGTQVGQVVPDTCLRLTDVDGRHPRTIPFNPKAGVGQVLQGSSDIRFLVLGRNNTPRVWDEASATRLRLQLQSHVRLSQDGSRMATSHRRPEDGRVDVAVYDTASGKQTALGVGHKTQVWTLAFDPDGARVASGDDHGVVYVWSTRTGAEVAMCLGHTSKVLRVAFGPGGTRLVTTSADGTVRQWDAATGQPVEPPFERHTGEVLSAAYSPDGELVASGGTDRTVRLWRAKGGQEVAVLHGHTGAVNEIAFTPDGQRLVTVSQNKGLGWLGDNTVGVWDVGGLPVLHGHENYVYPVAYSPDGRRIASGGWDHKVRLWDAATGEECATLPHPGAVRALAFGPDGTWLVSGCDAEEDLTIWDVGTGRIRGRIRGTGKTVVSLAVSPDGTRIAASTLNRSGYSMGVWEVATGQRLWAGKGTLFDFSPNGSWLAGRDADGKNGVLYDARDFRPVAPLHGHTEAINAITFRRDSGLALSTSADRTVRVWNPATAECVRVFEGHTDEVFAAVFHPDGTRVASGGRDRSVLIWDPASDWEGVRLPGHTSYVRSLAFSPGGRSLVSGSGDNSVRLWDTEPLRTRYEARRAAEALRPDADRLVDQLFREKMDAALVIAAVRADRSLGDAQRHAAFRAVLRASTARVED